MVAGLPFPDIDPIALSLGPFHVRWYALAYLAGIIGGLFYARWLADLDKGRRPNRDDAENILPWIVMGIILGGRFGYVLFYNFGYYIQNPLEALVIWHGGMSFHGGLLGVVTAIIVFSRYYKISAFAMGDLVSTVVPIGLFFGRIANFINGELFGRETDVPWAVNFPMGGGVPRHPSQLYEAVLEGLVLFVVLYVMARKPAIRHAEGTIFGTLLVGYGLSRFIIEYFREPDVQVGYLAFGLSMGQMLCLPMILAGGLTIAYARKNAAQKQP
jgi:phosphatidylglycerol:prolipoprotein diacylglycerol transferase